MDNSLVCCNRCKSTGAKIKYAFLFSLLVEDNSKCFLPIIIFEIDKVSYYNNSYFYYIYIYILF